MACKKHCANPCNATNDIKISEFAFIHFYDAGNNGAKVRIIGTKRAATIAHPP